MRAGGIQRANDNPGVTICASFWCPQWLCFRCHWGQYTYCHKALTEKGKKRGCFTDCSGRRNAESDLGRIGILSPKAPQAGLHILANSDASVLPSVCAKTLGIRNKLISKLYQHFRERGLPYGLQDSLCTLTSPLVCGLPRSSLRSTLDTGGGLTLTRRGLAPRKIRRASSRLSRITLMEPPMIGLMEPPGSAVFGSQTG